MDKNIEVYRFVQKLLKKNLPSKEAYDRYRAFIVDKGHNPILSRTKGCRKVHYGDLEVSFYKDGAIDITCTSAADMVSSAIRNLKSLLLISSLSDISYQDILKVSTITLPEIEDTKLSEEEYEQVRQFCLPLTQLTPNYSHWSHLEKKWV